MRALDGLVDREGAGAGADGGARADAARSRVKHERPATISRPKGYRRRPTDAIIIRAGRSSGRCSRRSGEEASETKGPGRRLKAGAIYLDALDALRNIRRPAIKKKTPPAFKARSRRRSHGKGVPETRRRNATRHSPAERETGGVFFADGPLVARIFSRRRRGSGGEGGGRWRGDACCRAPASAAPVEGATLSGASAPPDAGAGRRLFE